MIQYIPTALTVKTTYGDLPMVICTKFGTRKPNPQLMSGIRKKCFEEGPSSWDIDRWFVQM